MNVLVTCGPAITPIDEVRRITNFSTGTLGVTLANFFADAGHAVICAKSSGATTQLAVDPRVVLQEFATNAQLAALCADRGEMNEIDLILHAAALSDYEVAEVRDAGGQLRTEAKIPSRLGELHLTLRPALKVISSLRDWFPAARIVGWKYEVTGTRGDAIAAGRSQIESAQTDACVVNGRAWGGGFGLLDADGRITDCPDPAALFRALVICAGA